MTSSSLLLLLIAAILAPAPPQEDKPGIWSKLSIVDAHGHVGSFKGYDLDTGTLLDNIDRYGLRMVLVSNIDGANLPGTTRNLGEMQANRAAADIIRKHPRLLRGLIWTRPNDGNPKQVEPFLKESFEGDEKSKLFVGLKLHPMMNQFRADSSAVDGYLELCRLYGVPAVFHSDKPGTNADPEKIYAVARRYPAVPIILYHSVFLGPHETALSAVKQSLTRKDADLYLETSQVSPDEVLRAVREVGSDRVLFGTDATYFGKEHYRQYEAMVQTLRHHLSPRDFASVMALNAERLFRLK